MTSIEPTTLTQKTSSRLQHMACFLSGACCIEFLLIACMLFLWMPLFRGFVDSYGAHWSTPLVPVIILLDCCKGTLMIMPLSCGVLVALAVLPCLFARFLKPVLAAILNLFLLVLGAVGNILILTGILFTITPMSHPY